MTPPRGISHPLFPLVSRALSSPRRGGEGLSGTTNADVDVGGGIPARRGFGGSGRDTACRLSSRIFFETGDDEPAFASAVLLVLSVVVAVAAAGAPPPPPEPRPEGPASPSRASMGAGGRTRRGIEGGREGAKKGAAFFGVVL